MSGSHSHVGTISSKQLWVATSLTFAFCLGEAAVGYFSNSLALMADAGHNFADALALALSAFAIWMATKPADSKRTFGYHRVGILAALANAAGLVAMAGAIFWEALQRLYAPEPVQSGPMIWVALLAIILNSGIAWWLVQSRKRRFEYSRRLSAHDRRCRCLFRCRHCRYRHRTNGLLTLPTLLFP